LYKYIKRIGVLSRVGTIVVRLKKVLKQAGVVHGIKLLYPYCACHTKKEIHSRDTTV